MKNIFSFLILMIAFTGLAQEHGVCGFNEHQEQLFNENPGSRQAFHEHMLRINNGDFSSIDRAANITIPVVVHVLHDGGESNISYEQILSAIDMINADFQLLNADSVSVRNTTEAPFQPLTANMGIEFKLAKLDPNGECTNGVERRQTTSTFGANDDNAKHYNAGGLDAWPRTKYFNIWVVSTIEGSGGGTTLGYAQFPQPFAGSADEYGIVIRHDRMGNIGTATSGDRTLTHEIGHCVGLLHTFEGGCDESNFLGNPSNDCQDGGDYICDTPPVVSAQWSCTATQNTCNQVPTNDYYGTDVFDQFENFMSYSPCQYMFSEGQKAVVMDNFATISHLVSLTSASNLTATGVDLPGVLCKAEFGSSSQVICQGESVDYADQSYFNITSRSWNFAGGTPMTSSDSSLTVTYNTAGLFNVGLEVSDGNNNIYTEELEYMKVLPIPGEPLPYHEGFEFFNDLPDNHNWFVENDDSGQSWELNNDTYYTGGWAAKMNNFGVDNGSKDHLISGTIDLSSLSASDAFVLSFQYAYKKKNSGNTERLRVYISDDCGENWVLRKTISGSGLSDQVEPNEYIPGVGEWTAVEVTNITSAYYVDNLRIKFEFENDGGNNLYLDHINMSNANAVGITEDVVDNLTLFPNPVAESVFISMDIYDAGDYNMYLTNSLGQQVAVVYTGELISGQQTISYDMSDLPAGFYFLTVESNGNQKTTKLVKQ